jgi:radical SAM protein with 4Fe4S-binding SPASM domain
VNNWTRELNLIELNLLLKKLVEAGTSQLVITGGEPLVFKNLEGFFKILRNFQNLIISLNTNGLLLLDKKIQSIVLNNKDLITRVNLSIESGVSGIHNYIRGDGQFNKILSVIELCNQEQIPLLINTTIGPYNIDSIDSIFSLMKQYKIDTINFGLYIPWKSNKLGLKMLTREQVKTACEYLIEKEESSEYIIQTCSMPYLKFFSPGMEGACCDLFKELLTINYKGDLTVCMMDNFNIGSILDNNLEELIQAEEVKEYLSPDLLKSKIKGKCATCEKFNECFGCRFIAYAHTQDYYASDPYCPYFFPE